MQKFFISDSEFKSLTFSKDHSFQLIKVLRVKSDTTCYVGYNQKTYLVAICEILKDTVKFKILDEINLLSEFKFNVTLLQGLPKGKKLEDIIKHGTELGCKEIIPLNTIRCVKKDSYLNYERLSMIAKEAAEQSLREIVPVIRPVVNLKDLDVSTYSHLIVLYEDARFSKNNLSKIFKTINDNSNVAFLIGPEGGLAKEEIEGLKQKGAIIVGLSRRVLRTETAGFFILSALSYEKELSYD